jgi:hypothetical protein
MGFLIAVCIVVLLALVVLVVSAPIRSAASAARKPAPVGSPPDAEPSEAAQERRHELETAREAKYREIRDAELDFRTGKLSEEDYRGLDAELRAEALGILDALDRDGAEGASEERRERTDG